MILGATPIFTTAVTAVFVRRMPRPLRLLGACVGFCGIGLITYSPVGGGGTAHARGIALRLAGGLSAGIAFNIATPLQRTYGPSPVVVHTQPFAVVWILPFAIATSEAATRMPRR